MRRPGLILCCVLALTCCSSLVFAQVPTCTCASASGFGSCRISTGNYPGQGPTCAAVVPVAGQTFFYVADGSDGFVYRYQLNNGQLQPAGCGASDPLCFGAPLGSQPTPSGIAYNPTNEGLYWAIGGALYLTVPDIASPEFDRFAVPLATVDMARLADLLDLPTVGVLGGITYHRASSRFWGVDIVNDVYFAFGTDGQPIIRGESVLHFRNPESKDGQPAFGSSISYIEVDGEGFFDIDVGSLLDGRPTRVERMHAGDPVLGQPLGVSAGYHYPLSPFVGDDGFVTAVVAWKDACSPGKDAEVILEFGDELAGDAPALHVVSIDGTIDAGLSSFTCTTSGNNIELTWFAENAHTSLAVVRRDRRTGETKDVVALGGGGAGEASATDANVSDGAYEYSATITTVDGVAHPARSCLITVGRGTVLASTAYGQDTAPGDRLPFSATFVDALDAVLVADFNTGRGYLYDTDLNFIDSFNGPFTGNASIIGQTSGVAWSAQDGELIWTISTASGSNFVQRTLLVQVGENGYRVDRIGSAQRIRTPLGVNAPQLGDVAFDELANQFWGVDRRSGVAYSFDSNGVLTGKSFTTPLPNPRLQGMNAGLAGGGLAVVESTPDSLVLDWTVAASNAQFVNDLDRMSYERNFAGGVDDVTVDGVRAFSVDLAASTGSRALGGIVSRLEGDEEVAYVLTWDTRRVYKITLSEGIAGKEFIRGDANADEIINISDPSVILNYLFKSGDRPDCIESADADNDESVAISDAIYLFQYLFLNGPQPEEPFEACGRDFDEGLICEVAICR